MDPRNFAYLDYDAKSNHSWSNIKGYGNMVISKVNKNGNIKTTNKQWNKMSSLPKNKPQIKNNIKDFINLDSNKN